MKILPKRRDPRDFLPLRPVAFALLASLADGPRPGIAILDQINATVPGWPILGPGTLYRLMRELRNEGLLDRDPRGGESGDDRQAPHVLTPLGRAVMRAEAARLRRTLDLASESRAR
jgi:PadR family transcriptional regulator